MKFIGHVEFVPADGTESIRIAGPFDVEARNHHEAAEHMVRLAEAFKTGRTEPSGLLFNLLRTFSSGMWASTTKRAAGEQA